MKIPQYSLCSPRQNYVCKENILNNLKKLLNKQLIRRVMLLKVYKKSVLLNKLSKSYSFNPGSLN